MNRTLGILLFASLTLNIAFISGVVVHWWDIHKSSGTHHGDVIFAPPPVLDRVPVEPERANVEWQERFGDWPERRVHRLHERIQLKEEQRHRLARSLGELRNEMTHLAYEVRRSRQELGTILARDPGNRVLIQERIHLHNELQGRLDSLVAEAMVREANILSPEQRRRGGSKELVR